MDTNLFSHEYRTLISVLDTGDKQLFDKIDDSYLHDDKAIELKTLLRDLIGRLQRLPTRDELSSYGFAVCQTPFDFNYYFKELVEQSEFREAAIFSGKLQDLLKDRKSIKKVKSAIYEFQTGITKKRMDRSVTYLEDEEGRIEAGQSLGSLKEKTIPFGWAFLDKVLNGGLREQELAAIVARPSVGKTMLLISAAIHAWKAGNRVLFCSTEMGISQIVYRLTGMRMHVNPNIIRAGMSSRALQTFKSIREETKTLPQFMFLNEDMSVCADEVNDIVNYMAPDIFFIDSTYMLSPRRRSSGNMSSWEKTLNLLKDLKETARLANIPGVLCFQYNRGGVPPKTTNRTKQHVEHENDRELQDYMGLHNIYGGDSIGQICSVVVGARRGDGIYKNTRRIISVEKNREGECGGVFKLKYDTNVMDFSETPWEESNNGFTRV